MGEPVYVKQNDVIDIKLRLRIGNADIPLVSGTHRLLWSGENDDTKATLWYERDVTTYVFAYGVPAEGKTPLPLYDGRTTVGTAATVTVVDNSVDGKVDVTADASGDPEVTYQEIWMQKAGVPAGDPYYLVATFADGTHAVTPYVINVADTGLVSAHHGEDRSRTQGEAAVLPTPVTPVAALSGAGAGLCTNGAHRIAIVNRRHPDTDLTQRIAHEVTVVNLARPEDPVTLPASGHELIIVTRRVSA